MVRKKKYIYCLFFSRTLSKGEASVCTNNMASQVDFPGSLFLLPATATRDLPGDPAASAGRGHPLLVLSPEAEIFQIIKMNSEGNTCTVLRLHMWTRKAQKARETWKQGWVIQEEYGETVQHCREGLGKPEATLGLNLVWNVKGNNERQ